MNNTRNYGIDLLRLILMFMVCMLHILGQGGVLNASSAGTLGHKIFWLLEVLSYCSVDSFAIISGYMATDKPRKYEEIVEMWFQAFFYSFVVTLILTIIGINKSWGIFDMIQCALPVIFDKFWYFTAFFALFFAIPVLNKFVFTIDENTSKKAFILLIAMFSIIGVLGDPFKSYWGYSAIWLIVLYCIGALAKRIKLFESRKSVTLVLLWAACVLVTWVIRVFLGIGRVTNYVSPTILLSGMIMVILFSRLNLEGTIIAKLSPLAFGVYLFQLNQVIWNNIIKDSAAFVAAENIAVGVLYVFAFALAIFCIGLLVEFLRSKIAQLLRISLLSKKIVELVDKLFVRLFFVLR